MNGALCWDCNIIIFFKFIFSAKLWGERVSRLCTVEEAGFLHYKFLYWDHFLPTDFVTPEWIPLNRLAVPSGLVSASHSIPQPSLPLLPTLSNPQPSAVSPQNSNLPVLSLLPLTSELTSEENSLQVLSSMCGERWKAQVLTILRPEAWFKIPLRTHLVLFLCSEVQTITQLWDGL